MTFHQRREKPAKGHKPKCKPNGKTSSRITVSFDDKTWGCILYLAKKENKTVSEVIRDGMWSYTFVIRPEVKADKADNARWQEASQRMIK